MKDKCPVCGTKWKTVGNVTKDFVVDLPDEEDILLIIINFADKLKLRDLTNVTSGLLAQAISKRINGRIKEGAWQFKILKKVKEMRECFKK